MKYVQTKSHENQTTTCEWWRRGEGRGGGQGGGRMKSIQIYVCIFMYTYRNGYSQYEYKDDKCGKNVECCAVPVVNPNLCWKRALKLYVFAIIEIWSVSKCVPLLSSRQITLQISFFHLRNNFGAFPRSGVRWSGIVIEYLYTNEFVYVSMKSSVADYSKITRVFFFVFFSAALHFSRSSTLVSIYHFVCVTCTEFTM